MNSQWTGRGGMLHVSHGRRRYHQPHAVRLCSRFMEAGGIVGAPHDGVPGRFPRAFSCLLSMGWQDLACSRVSRVATAPSGARYVTLGRLGFYARTKFQDSSAVGQHHSVTAVSGTLATCTYIPWVRSCASWMGMLRLRWLCHLAISCDVGTGSRLPIPCEGSWTVAGR